MITFSLTHCPSCGEFWNEHNCGLYIINWLNTNEIWAVNKKLNKNYVVQWNTDQECYIISNDGYIQKISWMPYDVDEDQLKTYITFS
jgi:hypothetical protein